MQGETRERWQMLCEQAATERDPRRLKELVDEIISLLDIKLERLKTERLRAEETQPQKERSGRVDGQSS
jgi:hypothetical protein